MLPMKNRNISWWCVVTITIWLEKGQVVMCDVTILRQETFLFLQLFVHLSLTKGLEPSHAMVFHGGKTDVLYKVFIHYFEHSETMNMRICNTSTTH